MKTNLKNFPKGNFDEDDEFSLWRKDFEAELGEKIIAPAPPLNELSGYSKGINKIIKEILGDD